MTDDSESGNETDKFCAYTPFVIRESYRWKNPNYENSSLDIIFNIVNDTDSPDRDKVSSKKGLDHICAHKRVK